MRTDLFTAGAARHLGAATPYDRFFNRSVTAARLLSIPAARVDLPTEVELPTDRPLLFAANHSSLYDLVAALIALGNYGLTARIGVNARFFTNPVGGGFLRRLGCIPFSRDERERAEAEMVNALEDGQACALMPEGRIVKPAERVDGVGPGRVGISSIARAAGAAVVPVGFHGADRAWPPGSARLRFRPPAIKARFGPPILFSSDDHQTNVDELMTAISACVDQDPQLA